MTVRRELVIAWLAALAVAVVTVAALELGVAARNGGTGLGSDPHNNINDNKGDR